MVVLLPALAMLVVCPTASQRHRRMELCAYGTLRTTGYSPQPSFEMLGSLDALCSARLAPAENSRVVQRLLRPEFEDKKGVVIVFQDRGSPETLFATVCAFIE